MHLLLVVLMTFYVTAAQWVDPHSMDTRRKAKLPHVAPPDNPHCVIATPKECVSDMHLRRIVRLILNNAYLDKDVGEGYINIKLGPLEHQLLINFSQSTEKEDDVFNEVSTIFEKAFQKTVGERYQDLALTIQERMYYVLFNQMSGALVGACTVLFVAYRLIRAQFTWRSILKYFLFLAYIFDFVITYFHLVREEEVENLVNIKKLGTAPPECDPQKMSWWGFIKTQIDDSHCKAYYLATYPNSVFVIAPSRVFTRQFRTLIVEPCGDVGEAFGKFGRGMFTTLPWGLNVVIFPVMLVTVCALVFILFLFITKPHFKISLFHLFSIELGKTEVPVVIQSPSRRQVTWKPSKKRKRIESGREVGGVQSERAYIEDVSSSSKKRRPKKVESEKSEEESAESDSSEGHE